ncbi:hypothetical protein [Brevundimonas sp.]|uniref:hypothetical protein n=1 Tax=Brevundimonas sp. TaxID=1871086 RepID=UPI002FCA88BE
MRIHQILCGAAAASLLAFSASAQEGQAAEAQGGQYAEALTRIVADARAGTCSELMSAGVQLACQRRIDQIALTLERFGDVQKITLLKAEDRGGVLYETYELGFVDGFTMTWIIGGLYDGQFSTAYSEDG